MKKPIPFGKYYLLERINVGGMAEVFRAKAYGVEGFERLIAVKRILPNIAEDKDFITMFIDEAKIAVQLNHANIAQIFDLGVVDGAYYIALEHIHGRDLRAIFDRGREYGEPMPIAQACFVLMKVCEGLDYAHNKRDQGGRELDLVHRDVSPQNMLVSFEGEVKLIDFGIAKAAGKGTKTQAGILKGKFGYMSPEQVRGLPVDRKSDIFSCGIVLYELLTGERLFVGESDFSTLEKVRNVEILPPTTYNRKIPDELERIVLKALAKDVEDRYQNAIDLHDELQAFVYTAGEFYSRKDLAGWMKKTFAREIEHETAKLEQFRQIPPPSQQAAEAPPPERQRRATASVPPPPPPTNGRRPPTASSPPPVAAVRGDDLEWDDDELETQIYDGQDEAAAAESGAAPMAAAPPVLSAPAVSPSRTLMGAGPMAAAQAAAEPDLSALVKSSAEWPSKPELQDAAGLGAGAPSVSGPPPANGGWANGSGQTATPFTPEALSPESDPLAPPPAADDPSAVVRLVNQQLGTQPIYENAFDSQALVEPHGEQSGGGFLLMGAIALLLLLAGGGGLFWYFSRDTDTGAAAGDNTQSTVAVTSKPTPGEERQPELPGQADMDTGFDIIVDPTGAQVKLNGSNVGEAPRTIRNIRPGRHLVEVEAPGFITKRHEVIVEQSKAEQVHLKLDAMEIQGKFTSTPPGALVTLVSDGDKTKLGTAPAGAPLDPRKKYEVVFKKPGYVTERRPVSIDGSPEAIVAVVLERATPAPTDRPGGRTPKPTPADPPKDDRTPKPPKDSGGSASTSGDPGTLLLGSKPPCKIYIDGKDTGLTTPQRDIQLSPGKHKVTLVNNEYNIKESFTVKIKSGETVRKIPNYMDKVESQD